MHPSKRHVFLHRLEGVDNFRLPESVFIPTCNYHLDHRPKSSFVAFLMAYSSSTLTRGFPILDRH